MLAKQSTLNELVEKKENNPKKDKKLDKKIKENEVAITNLLQQKNLLV
jgi:hypothetical protein